jgi:SAM-dependent methyltransferase
VRILRRRRPPRADGSPEPLTARLAALEAENQRLVERCRSLEARLALVDERPVPPEALRVRVGHWPDPDHFLAVGRKIFWDVKRLLSLVDRRIEEFGTILDFGCGCGRVLRHFLALADGREVHGADIDPEGIGWCREHLSFAACALTGDLPPLPYPDGRFDLVLAISVFSHLPEDRQFAWLGELRRVLRPGGLLIASVHGEALLLAPDQAGSRDALLRNGLLYVRGSGTPGLPDYYQTAYHTRAYLEREWARYFDVLHFLERGINNQQDALVCRRPLS